MDPATAAAVSTLFTRSQPVESIVLYRDSPWFGRQDVQTCTSFAATASGAACAGSRRTKATSAPAGTAPTVLAPDLADDRPTRAWRLTAPHHYDPRERRVVRHSMNTGVPCFLLEKIHS